MNKDLLLTMLLMFFSAVVFAENSKKIELPVLHHIVNIPLTKDMTPPDNFPLGKYKELVCKTCHGLKDMDKIDVNKVDKKHPDFLRDGPYQPITSFCYQCHNKQKAVRNNIHQLLDEEGNIKEEQCKYCHKKVLKTDRAQGLDEVELRLPIDKLCYGCHLQTPHLNALQHQVEPDEDKLKALKVNRKKKGIYMPLDKDNKMLCVTCHTSHPKGVLDQRLAAAKQVSDDDLDPGIDYIEHPWSAIYDEDKKARLEEWNLKNNKKIKLHYQRIKSEVLLRLPAKNGELCLVCHEFKD